MGPGFDRMFMMESVRPRHPVSPARCHVGPRCRSGRGEGRLVRDGCGRAPSVPHRGDPGSDLHSATATSASRTASAHASLRSGRSPWTLSPPWTPTTDQCPSSRAPRIGAYSWNPHPRRQSRESGPSKSIRPASCRHIAHLLRSGSGPGIRGLPPEHAVIPRADGTSGRRAEPNHRLRAGDGALAESDRHSCRAREISGPTTWGASQDRLPRQNFSRGDSGVVPRTAWQGSSLFSSDDLDPPPIPSLRGRDIHLSTPILTGPPCLINRQWMFYKYRSIVEYPGAADWRPIASRKRL